MKNLAHTISVQLLVLGPTIASAETWVTVDDCQLEGNASYGAVIATGSTGSVFAASTARTSAGITGIVRRSFDHGATWATVDTSSDWDEIHALAVSPLGPVVVVGSTRPIQPNGQDPLRWFTRLSHYGGSTWATVDNFVYSSGESCRATAVDVAADGTIYVAGWDNTGRWLVRRKLAASEAWSTVANLKHPKGYLGPLWGIKVARSGIFLAGVFSNTAGPKSDGVSFAARTNL